MPSRPRLEPIWSVPALRFTLQAASGRQRWLACSELHLGLESGLARQGAFLRSRTATLADGLRRCVDAGASDHLLILGDVKDRIGGVSRQERRDVPAFFERFADLERIVVARGNHDVGLSDLLPRRRFPNVTIGPAGGLVLQGTDGASVGALHGHAWPRPDVVASHVLLVGHTHAAARLIDETGRVVTEWAWARGRLDPAKVAARYGTASEGEVVVFPPFNPLLGGAAINEEGLLGPMRNLVSLSDLRLVLLDGRDLGPVGSATRRPARRGER